MQRTPLVVYVDSGSSDDSARWAKSQGVDVVELDMSRPFTAARARNEGFRRLLMLWPRVDFVQFVDGDCEVVAGWLDAASDYLARNPRVAVVCGRRRERYPEASIFNAQCDREWDTPLGEALACGGDAMFRRVAMEQADGYRDSLIAGEEPELCLRLRASGWLVWRLDHDMTLHDAAILRWSQWCRRTMRAGHAFAEVAWLHGAPPERYWVRETRRAVLWGVALPAITAAAVMTFGAAGLGLLLAYPLQMLRLTLKAKPGERGRFSRSMLLVLGRFPEAAGVLQYHYGRLSGRQRGLIEYK